MTALLRDVDPDIVITHPPQDYMADHEITSRLVRSACFSAPVPAYSLEGLSESRQNQPYSRSLLCQPMEGKDLFGEPINPGMFVDISGVMDRKEVFLACHASQLDWLRKHHGIDEYLKACVGGAGNWGNRLLRNFHGRWRMRKPSGSTAGTPILSSNIPRPQFWAIRLWSSPAVA